MTLSEVKDITCERTLDTFLLHLTAKTRILNEQNTLQTKAIALRVNTRFCCTQI